MFTIESDRRKNRLYVNIDFGILDAEAEKFQDELKKNIHKFDGNFTALLDLSKANIYRSSFFEYLNRIGKSVNGSKMDKCALVVKSQVLNNGVSKQLREHQYNGKVFDNIPDAEKFLNES